MSLGAGILAIVAATCLSGCGPSGDAVKGPRSDQLQSDPGIFFPPSMCRNCHERIDDQFRESMHSQALSDPLFQAHYYREFLPEFHADPEAFAGERSCLSCHSPIAYVTQYEAIRKRAMKVGNSAVEDECSTCHGDSPLKLSTRTPGVVCDVCHRIDGHTEDIPGNSNYVLTPGIVKFGPLQYKNDFHREYRELQTRSELCATCHQTVNRYGVRIRSTYDEWKEGPYAARGIQCQDCHMNKVGFLTGGRPTFESGQAAKMTMGIKTRTRDKLSTHRFPGAHSNSQVDGALTLDFRVDGEYATAGEPLRLALVVGNEKTGHRMPTGSVELRTVWLDVVARIGDDELPVQLEGEQEPWGVSGASSPDEEVYGDEIPPGRRLYRVVFTDGEGKQTLFSYDARGRVFDNRLPAGARRIEEYLVDIPAEARGWIQLDATLYYLAYPPSFAKRLKVPALVPVPFATAKGEILVNK